MWATVDAYRGVHFEWGTHDCCLFGARVYDAVHDTKLVEALKSYYTDTSSGELFLASFESLEGAVIHFLGAPQKKGLTKRGQICLISTMSADGVGVCVGHQVAVASPVLGVAFYPYSVITRSWPDPT